MKKVTPKILPFSLGLLLLLVMGCSKPAITTTVTQTITPPPSTVTTTATTTAPPTTITTTATATTTAPPTTVTTTATATTTVTATVTATPSATTSNGSIADPKGDVAFGFIDMVSVDVEHSGENVTGTLQMANLPSTLVFNQAPYEYYDYGWGILFNVDNNPATGGPWLSSEGVDYALLFTHTSNGGSEVTGSLKTYCQAQLMKFNTSAGAFVPVPGATVDIEGNTIVLKGTIPGLNDTSKWTAETVYWNPNSQTFVQDYLPQSWYGM